MTTGECAGLPISWTVKVPINHQILLNVSHVNQTCAYTRLSVRDGVDEENILLYQFSGSSNTSVFLVSSFNIIRMEMSSDIQETNLTQCFAQFLWSVSHQVSSSLPPVDDQQLSFAKIDILLQVLMTSPVLLVLCLTILAVVCSMVLALDFQVKKAKYSRWKAIPSSGYNTPTSGCKVFVPENSLQTSMSTISDYVPLLSPVEVHRGTSMLRMEAELQRHSQSVPATPLLKRKGRLGRRKSETDMLGRVGGSVGRLLPGIGDRLVITAWVEEWRRMEAWRRSSEEGSRKRSVGSVREVERSESDMTLKATSSVSEFSCTSGDMNQELEFDLYDCHIDNAMAAPGSFFATPYYDHDMTPTGDFEMVQLFPEDGEGSVDSVDSEEDCVTLLGSENEDGNTVTSGATESLSVALSPEVTLRKSLWMTKNVPRTGVEGMVVSVTSDLTASITSSCCYSGDEEEDKGCSNAKENKILTFTNFDELQFVDE